MVEWDAKACSWADFRGQVLGPTDPAEAPAGSLRGMIMARWQELGLKAEPDVGDNGVHASASPFEALAERMNWLGADLEADGFGSALLEAGIPAKMIRMWTVDPQVAYLDGSKGSLFDALEDMDAADCMAKCKALTRGNVDSMYLQDGPEAQKIAEVIPYFPFKGIPRFYDIGGFLKEPEVFQMIVDIFVDRYKALDIDSICGLDGEWATGGVASCLTLHRPREMHAHISTYTHTHTHTARGFVLGPPIALGMKKPFFMMRKPVSERKRAS